MDDGVAVGITSIEGGEIVSACRLALGASPSTELVLPELATLGSEAPTFAAAFAAARFATPTRLCWRPTPDGKRLRMQRRRGIAMASALFAASIAAAVFAPAARASRDVGLAQQALSVAHAASEAPDRLQAELRSVSEDLDRLTRFERERGNVIALLAAISEQLPESTAIVTLRLDERDGSLLALTPHASDVLSRLSAIREISSPRIVGSVTRELRGVSRVERVSIRFGRPRGDR